MKVLMLGWELPPHNSGGLGVACYQLCHELSKHGVDIEFVLPYEAEHNINFMNVRPAIPQGIGRLRAQLLGVYDSYVYDKSRPLMDGLSGEAQQVIYEKAVVELVTSEAFDIVHAHDWLTFRAALRVKEVSGLPIVLHVHSIERDRSGGNFGNPLVREIEETSLMLSDHVIAVSQFTKDAIIREYGIPANKIEVVHNSIESKNISIGDEQNSYAYLTAMRARGYRVVVSVSRLTIQKGLSNLLRAAKEVIERVPKTIFLIVGSGDQYFELIELAAQLGIAKNVIFTGFLRGKQWRDSFRTSDLFIMPSVSEPFGIVPLEAVGYGSPVLISKQSGIAEVLNNSLKVDFWDIKKMVDQIAGVVQNDALRDELRDNAYSEYQKLTWRPAAKKVMSIYEDHLVGQGV